MSTMTSMNNKHSSGSSPVSLNVTKRSLIISANKNESLKNYIFQVRHKQSVDKDYAKWDLSLPLPKLPVPDLSETLKKYLNCIKSIRDEQAYKRTEAIVNEFLKSNGLGERLQSILLKKAEESENWAYNWWLDDMYLFNKIPLPINSNPGMVYPTESFCDEDAYLRFSAQLISGILDYKLVIDNRELPIDRCTCREKGQPLCMEQYYRLFSSYRVPGVEKDKLIVYNNNLMLEPEHIIVLCCNQMFVLDVIVNFTRLSEDQLYHQLKRIRKQAHEDKNTMCEFANIGFLTSLPRDEWALARQELVRESTNRDCFDLIERSIFILCLDKKVDYAADTDQSNVSKDPLVQNAFQMLHGCGSTNNSGNRWYDKTMQFIVSENGVCGLNYEHSTAEGIVVIELTEHLFRYMAEKRKQKLYRMPSICELPVPHKLRWKMNDSVNKWIEKSKRSFDERIANLDLYILKYEKYGREFPKKVNMSPDSFIQCALQLAYYKLYGKLVSTYESASTRRFRQGRVDNIRANSCETLDWVRSMQSDSQIQNEQKFALFQKAVQHQTNLMVDNILGKGMDCHMLALKQIAIENDFGVPDLFQDDSYAISNHFALSTSQIPTTMEDSFMCYGPVVPDGYGCSYNPKKDYILFCISTFLACSQTNTKLFADSLTQSLDQIFDLCSQFI